MSAPPRSSIPASSRWRLEAIYAREEDFEAELLRVDRELPGLSTFAGTLDRGPGRLREFFELEHRIAADLELVATYAHLRHDEDTTLPGPRAAHQRARDLWARFAALRAFAEPELMALEEKSFKAYVESPELAPYRVLLERLQLLRPHVLGHEEERLIAELSPVLAASGDAFRAFADSDLKFPDIADASGATLPLTQGAFYRYLIHPEREVRRQAFEGILGGFAAWPNLLAGALGSTVKKHTIFARVRGYGSALEAALKPNFIEAEVYHRLLEAVHAGMSVHHKYLKLRRKALGLGELRFYDLYVPMAGDPGKTYGVEEAQKLLLEALQPLGGEYVSEVERGLKSGWVDWFENNGKRGGAYSSGCYRSEPYILMNFDGTLHGVLTLAHEMGHSMHSLLSRRFQPYWNSEYPIFLAEVASIFNEQLMLQRLRAAARTRAERLVLANYELEQLRTTFFRQTMFAEFELAMHREVEEGRPLTAASLQELYGRILDRYFGSEVAKHPLILAEWSRIPHFYYNFYVYQYATGIAAAFALARRVLAGGDAERAAYLGFLGSGCSRDPVPTLRGAGVDMLSPHPVAAVLSRMEELIGECESLLEKP